MAKFSLVAVVTWSIQFHGSYLCSSFLGAILLMATVISLYRNEDIFRIANWITLFDYYQIQLLLIIIKYNYYSRKVNNWNICRNSIILYLLFTTWSPFTSDKHRIPSTQTSCIVCILTFVCGMYELNLSRIHADVIKTEGTSRSEKKSKEKFKVKETLNAEYPRLRQASGKDRQI